MANVTLTSISSLLKEVYETKIPSQLQDEMILGKRIEKSSEGVVDTTGGKYVYFPVIVGRNQGISYRAEGEALGDPGAAKYNHAKVELYHGYGRARFNGQIFDQTAKNPQAFAQAADMEMESLKTSLLKDQQRILYGDGTGLLAAVSAATSPAANTVTVGAAGTYWLEVGQAIDILNRSTGAAVATGRTITAINYTTGVVTFDGATAATATTDGIYRAGNYTSGTRREPNGLGNIVASTGVLHDINPSTEPKWAAISVALGGALTEEAMIRRCDDVRVNGGKISAIFTSLGVRRAYFNLLRQDRQFVNTQTFDGGYTGLPFNYGTEIPVVEDPDCPAGTMYFLTEKDITIRQTKDWHFDDRDGSIFKWVGGYDSYDVMMKRYWNVSTYRRNGHAVMTTITEA